MDIPYSDIEKKWKAYWTEHNTNQVEDTYDKPKFYILDMFPYPSGSGLHVGHPLGYIATDIYARFKKMSGFNVLHPMGFDAFGLPAEQYAIQTGVHPSVSTEKNIEQYKKQLNNIGFNYDWSRSVNTSTPDYYKWTQWIFIKLFNHYYDVVEKKAMPIENLFPVLAIEGSKQKQAYCEDGVEFTADDWNHATDAEKDEMLMNYRLAFRRTSYVNWCEALGTVLANDEVKEGLSERGGHPVEQKAMMQWSLRITAYAERLLSGLDQLEWSDSLKAMQKNWIGKSKGAQVFFDVKDSTEKIEIFTTRPDTIFGSTFMVLAPELDVVQTLTTPERKEAVDQYIQAVSSKSERERMAEVKEVSGAFTGAYAIHPFTGEELPIWISEYVLKGYGTGAIMAVPSDDERDRSFAEKFDLPILEVVDKSDFPNAASSDKVGKMVNSDFLDGLSVKKAISRAIKEIIDRKIGSAKVNYRLRDANYSRQRYWGEPFPITYKDGVTHTLTNEQLPLELPELDNFKPGEAGQSPLARVDSWTQTDMGMRETDTMPGFAGSSWYFLRYMDAKNPNEFASKDALNYWKEVDLYVGGTEHAVGHLMYSRFWHKFLYDLGFVPTEEPFKKLINQGMIQGVIEFIYLKKEKENGKSVFYSADLVEDEEDFARIPVHIDFVKSYGSPESYLDLDSLKEFGEWRKEYKDAIFRDKSGDHTLTQGDNVHILTVSEVGKMSKRYFNVVNPDDVVAKYGADCFRMYEMFLGPIEQSKPWDTNGIDGVAKFLRKYWSLYFDDENNFIVTEEDANVDEFKVLHRAIKKITGDIEKFSFNTSVSAFMVAINELRKMKCHKKEILEPLNRLIAPFAPFVSEEIHHSFGNSESVHHSEFPKFDPSKIVENEITYPVCFNGKKKFLAKFAATMSKDDIEKAVLELDELKKYLGDKAIKKIIVVPNRIVNLIV